MLNDLSVVCFVMKGNDCAEVFEGSCIALAIINEAEHLFVLSLRCFSGQLIS